MRNSANRRYQHSAHAVDGIAVNECYLTASCHNHNRQVLSLPTFFNGGDLMSSVQADVRSNRGYGGSF